MSNFPQYNGLSSLNKMGTVEDFIIERDDIHNIIKSDSFFFDAGIVEEVDMSSPEATGSRTVDLNDLYGDTDRKAEKAPIIRLARIWNVNFDSFKSFSDMKLYAGSKMSKLMDQAGLLTMAGIMHHIPNCGKFEFGNPNEKGTELKNGGLILCSPDTYKKMIKKNWLSFHNDGNIAPIMKLKGVTVSMIDVPIGDGFVFIEKNAFIYTEGTNPRARMEVDRIIGEVDQLAANHVFILQPKGFAVVDSFNEMVTDTPFEESNMVKLSYSTSWEVVNESAIGIRYYTI